MLCDTDRTVGKAYGAARADDDPLAALPYRYTYLIDPEGKIRNTYEVKDVSTHADEVLADIKKG